MALRRWIGERGSAPGPMFPSRNHQGISRFRLHGLMKGYCAAAGIPAEKAHMHALKHSCGTHLSAREADIVAIQDHLGHASIGNTMKYVAIAKAVRRVCRASGWLA
jgi:site-specific recombinase XerD